MVFSVIVPVFNVEDYIKDCVNSILSQTFRDYEILLIDDGSTDLSGRICEEFAEKYMNIKVIHQKNKGQAAARNKGVSLARGEYIFFIDSDDVIAEDTAFETLHKRMAGSPDIIAFRYKKWFPDRSTDMNISFAGIMHNDKKEIIQELVKRDAFFCSCWSKTVRRELLKANSIVFDETSKCEDMDWYFRVVQNAEDICLVDMPLIDYRQREGSVTKKSGEKGFIDNIAVIEKWRETFENEKDERWQEVMLSALAKLYCNLLISFSGNYRALKKYSKDVYNQKSLLNYDLNPRTKLFRKVSNLVGIKTMCQMLRIASAMR